MVAVWANRYAPHLLTIEGPIRKKGTVRAQLYYRLSCLDWNIRTEVFLGRGFAI